MVKDNDKKSYWKVYNSKPKVMKRKREWYKEHPQTVEQKERRKKYNQKPEIKEKKKIYMRDYPKNKIKANQDRYRIKKGCIKKPVAPKNKEEARKRIRVYQNAYRKRPKINIIEKLRCRISFIKRQYPNIKKYPRKEYGIDYMEIIEHLKPFSEDISLYDIHHMKPLFKFTFINEEGDVNIEEVRKAFAPENHQWILRSEHRKINHRNL